MTSTTHQMFALLSALILLSLYPVSLGPLIGTMAVIATMVGALTPDLDQPTANIWRRMIGGNTIGNVFKAFSGGHRHLTHSFVGIIGIGLALDWAIFNLLNPAYTDTAFAIWMAFMIGYISHPIADTFTDQGVPWFWPLHFKIRIPPGPEEVRVTTDSFVERVLVRSGIIIIGVLMLQTKWPLLLDLFR